MKISQLMSGRTPDPDYAEGVTNDNMVLAVDCGSTPATAISASAVAGFAVVQKGITGVDSSMNPITEDKTYLRVGTSTTKTGTQRGFEITGDRIEGDEFQKFALSHAIKYGTGSAVQRRYVYFNILTGKGESGLVSIIVNSDGSGEAGEAAQIEIELKCVGEAPEEYTYAAS